MPKYLDSKTARRLGRRFTRLIADINEAGKAAGVENPAVFIEGGGTICIYDRDADDGCNTPSNRQDLGMLDGSDPSPMAIQDGLES